jgi:NarL family two-component system response regulator LiaR
VITEAVHVLIVDDQESFRSAARLVIESTEGFEVVGEARSGEEGVAMATNLHPNLILMDINLPGIDGLEATRRIVSMLPEIKVVGLSTYTEYEERVLKAGARAFVSKSEFEPTKLAEIWASDD